VAHRAGVNAAPMRARASDNGGRVPLVPLSTSIAYARGGQGRPGGQKRSRLVCARRPTDGRSLTFASLARYSRRKSPRPGKTFGGRRKGPGEDVTATTPRAAASEISGRHIEPPSSSRSTRGRARAPPCPRGTFAVCGCASSRDAANWSRPGPVAGDTGSHDGHRLAPRGRSHGRRSQAGRRQVRAVRRACAEARPASRRPRLGESGRQPRTLPSLPPRGRSVRAALAAGGRGGRQSRSTPGGSSMVGSGSGGGGSFVCPAWVAFHTATPACTTAAPAPITARGLWRRGHGDRAAPEPWLRKALCRPLGPDPARGAGARRVAAAVVRRAENGCDGPDHVRQPCLGRA
jgi:hypothetical protein